MSYTEEQLWSLLDDAYGMPYGPGQIALIEQIIGHADAMGSTQLSFAARLQGTTSYVHGGEPVRSFATFAWCLAEFDRNPTAYQREQRILLWQFKYMISAMTKFPEIPLDRTYAALDDMQRRWQETGHSMHAVFAYRHVVANHIGDLEAAERYYTQWCAAPRDDLSDCVGCDPSSKAWWLSQRGRDEEAVSLGEPVLSGRLTCSEQPQSMLETLMFPYLRTGRLDQARDAHRRAYRLHRPNLADMASIAEHIDFCARTGNEPRALEIIERHLGWLDRAPSPWAALLFASSSARALRRAHALDADLTLFRPAHGDREASRVSATVLADELEHQATELGARFDERNGTPRIGDVVRRRLSAEPLVEYLPLSPTAARRAPHAEQSTVVPPRDPGTASVTDIFAKTPTPSTTDTVSPPAAPVSATPAEISVPGTSGPDELLDLIEEHYEADRDDHAAAGLDAFDARYGSVELTTRQQARLVDARASRLADGQDFASAERFWREAAELYAASEDPEGEHRALARAGAARSWRGEQADGLPLLEEATEWLLAHG